MAWLQVMKLVVILFSFYLTLCISPSIFLVWKWSLSNIYSVDSILICWLLLIFPFKNVVLLFWPWSIILIFLQWFHCLDIMCVCVRVRARARTCMCACKHAQLYLTLCDTMDCNPPGSSVHGLLQAGEGCHLQEWVAISPSRGSSSL